MATKILTGNDFVAMDEYGAAHRLRVDLVYANACHPENIFGTALYRAGARLWLHRDFASVVLGVAERLQFRHGAALILKDGLRTVEAQALMQETDIVRAHPEWLDGPNRLLSRPGQGGHPRGMAVDVAVDGPDGPWDMGTVFDTMTPQSARGYADLPDAALENRRRLETAFTDSAAELGLPLLPLPSEWWDFRFPAAYSEQYAPVSDRDLPPHMRMAAFADSSGADSCGEDLSGGNSRDQSR